MLNSVRAASRFQLTSLTALLMLASSAHADSFQMRVPIKGLKQVAGAPAPSDSVGVSVSAPSLNFGNVELGKPATLSLTVTNAGKAPAPVAIIQVTEGNALFTSTHTCGANLAAESSCKVDVTFSPITQSAVEGNLQLLIGSTALDISLTGTGAAPVANASIWTPFTMPVSAYWRDISYGNGVFVSTDASVSGKTAYSSDGVTWQTGNMPRAGSWTTTYGDGKFVAVGWGNGGPWSATSTNGSTWKLGGTPPPGILVERVNYSNGIYVASAQMQNQGTAIIARSTDGVTWVAVPIPLKAQFMGATAGGGKFVLTAVGTEALISLDGLTWSKVSMPANGLWISVTHGNGRFVAVSQGSTNASAVSTDGITWTKGLLPPGFSAADITYGNGKFVASGTTGKTLQSTDGLTWTENVMPSTIAWTALGFGNGTFVTLGNNSNQGAYTQ